WTWEEIENDWLAGDKLALSPQAVVAAFNRIERAFGRAWIEASRMPQGTPAHGIGPTLHVVITAYDIAALDGLAGAQPLLDGLRENDPTAGAEAMAIHLLRTARPGISVELYPSARVGERQRQPDFCVCEPGGVWTYVEVTQPDVTEAQRRVEDVSWRLTELLADMKGNFGLGGVLG